MADPTTDSRMKGGSRPQRFWHRRSWPQGSGRRWLVRLLLLLLLLPVVMVVVYRFVPVPVTPLMAIRLMEGEGLSKDWVGYDQLSPNLRRAAIASEDATFC
ncbi:MAG TPA: monofunctional biosynthetic peptidoglycan transglycosylase, partial [Stellaceae bacterium]|nr:monofunctional biosynthetic peptidoglycan transglycosylase [Stellaceae bacterium]